MRNNLIKEYTESMDSLHFSADTKEALTHMLMNQTVDQAPSRRFGRKFLLVALAAALVLTSLTGAAVLTRWSKSAQAHYNPTQQEKEDAERLGLSSMLDTDNVISATENGITITLVQTIVDKYTAQLTFRIEGFDLPEGETPQIQMESIEVKDVHSAPTPIRFYDGTIQGNGNQQVYADGSPLRYAPDGSPILDYTAADGSLEFSTILIFSNGGEHLDKEVEVQFSYLGTETQPSLIYGGWNLKWTLTGMADTLISKPNLPIGDTGITLLEAEISPISLLSLLKIDNSSGIIHQNETENGTGAREIYQTMDALFVGVLTEDGTLIPCGNSGFASLYSDAGVQLTYPEYSCIIEEQAVLYTHHRLTNCILDPSKVCAFAFLKDPTTAKQTWELTEEDLYLVPIQ